MLRPDDTPEAGNLPRTTARTPGAALLPATAAYLGHPATVEALGGLAAQRVRDAIQREEMTVDHAWLMFCELAATHGWKSAACRAYLRELAKPRGAQ